MKTIADNRKAKFNYFLLEEYQAGLVLKGCEIKSIRQGNVNMSDGYCTFENGELILKNVHISEYKDAGYTKVEPKRDRKLLLTKRELRKIEQKVKIKGNSIVPVKLYINDHNLAKMTISLAKGKKEYDKSQTIKERDLDREMREYK